MAKSPYTPKFRAKVSQEYIDGNGSYTSIAQKYQVGTKTLQKWVGAYRIHGIGAFVRNIGNNSYTKEFKLSCIEKVIKGEGSPADIAFQENINPAVLESWIKLYNANRELMDYIPKREVCMAKARKTTLEERKEITEYCITHGKDYSEAATRYDVSYNQIYSWVKKYLEYGEEGLIDKRGRHKNDDEVDELERLRRENQRLMRKLEEQDMLVELLKKVKEFEGM